MTYHYSLFLRDQYLGDGVGKRRFHGNDPLSVRHILWLCPQCGDIWARLVVNDTKATWLATHYACDKCGVGDLNLLRYTELESGPDAWLAREFLLALEHGDVYCDVFWDRRVADKRAEQSALSNAAQLLEF